ncbi:MAG TPA: argininosuccinate lyase [Thermoplasmatales archaeon]|nr:argininosuccinate lyase [Thermoplasmatales archaeon]
MKLWSWEVDKNIERFTVGEDYLLDRKLVKYDCQASIAHVKMLEKIGILRKEEAEKLIEALEEIMELDRKGKFIIKREEEDCHTAIENYLVKKLGEVGKKVHTARSRNDQILAALRLYYKEEISSILKLIDGLTECLSSLMKKYGSVKIPGYTHTRKAMPSSIAIWAKSFIESMEDNKKLLKSVAHIIDQSPLGSGAGYGLPIKVDRKFVAKLLGFRRVQSNPLYVQNSRGKFESSILHVLGQIMLDLNRMASDIILFSSSEFGYFELPKEVCTGSSIMPHKKNPDALELIRAKYHQILSFEFEVKSISGNLISGYHRDLQLTKEPMIRGFDITKSCLKIMGLILDKLRVNTENCEKAMTRELYSVEKVYQLVEKGKPFRDAYTDVASFLSGISK